MGSDVKKILKVGITIAIVLGLISWFMVPWGSILPKKESPMNEQIRVMVSRMFGFKEHYDSVIFDQQKFYERCDEAGNYYYIATISPKLEEALPKFVFYYNNDPKTPEDMKVSEEYIRYRWTDGVMGTFANAGTFIVYGDTSKSSDSWINNLPRFDEEVEKGLASYQAFMEWLISVPQLVYARDVTWYRGSGEEMEQINRYAGEEWSYSSVKSKPLINNYRFLTEELSFEIGAIDPGVTKDTLVYYWEFQG